MCEKEWEGLFCGRLGNLKRALEDQLNDGSMRCFLNRSNDGIGNIHKQTKNAFSFSIPASLSHTHTPIHMHTEDILWPLKMSS